MDSEFWHNKWQRGEIGFHQAEINPHLIAHFGKLDLAKGSRVLLPLCGKTHDIAWLLQTGYHVIGIELSELAITALFEQLNITPSNVRHGKLIHYQAPNLDIYVGDFFDLSREQLGNVDAIYDRAAIVALPPEMRINYAHHLMAITQSAPQLLITFDYEQSLMAGPPFSVNANEVEQHYQSHYTLIHSETKAVAGGFKGKIPTDESVWLLQKA